MYRRSNIQSSDLWEAGNKCTGGLTFKVPISERLATNIQEVLHSKFPSLGGGEQMYRRSYIQSSHLWEAGNKYTGGLTFKVPISGRLGTNVQEV